MHRHTIKMMTSDQQPVSVQPAPCRPPVYVVSTSGRRENFAAKTGMWLGKSQVVLGSLCIILNMVSMVYHGYYGPIGLGVICGALTITAGGLGIGAAKKKKPCLIVGFMVLSILAAVAAGFVILESSLQLSHVRYMYRYRYYKVYLALKILTLIAGLVVAVCAIWASVLGCKVTCCFTQPSETFEAVYQGGTAAPVAMIQATTVPPTKLGIDIPPTHYTPGMATTAPSTKTKGDNSKM